MIVAEGPGMGYGMGIYYLIPTAATSLGVAGNPVILSTYATASIYSAVFPAGGERFYDSCGNCLRDYLGFNAAGDWIVTFYDTAPGNVGSVKFVEIEINSCEFNSD